MRRIKMNLNGDARNEKSVSPENLSGRLMEFARKLSAETPEKYKIQPVLKIYKIRGDRHRIVATSPANFLHLLHAGSRFDSEGTDEEFMHRFAQRLQQFEGYLVSTESPEAFLDDLIRHGFVSVE